MGTQANPRNDTIKLYGYATSPFVAKVAAYLKFKKLDYEHVHVRPRTNEQIQFTGQTQVPVLEINGEWRKESSELGIWLDERYPEPPLLGDNDQERETILAIDRWVSDLMIPARFREQVDWTSLYAKLRTGWRLARIVHSRTPVPLSWRVVWPLAVGRADFIVRMVGTLDRTEPMEEMRARVIDELALYLGAGPFLGGLAKPSLADLSAYTTLMSSWLIGLQGEFSWRERPEIVEWARAVKSHLPANPLAVDDRFIARQHP